MVLLVFLIVLLALIAILALVAWWMFDIDIADPFRDGPIVRLA